MGKASQRLRPELEGSRLPAAPRTPRATGFDHALSVLEEALDRLNEHAQGAPFRRSKSASTKAYWDPIRRWVAPVSLKQEKKDPDVMRMVHQYFLLDHVFPWGKTAAEDLLASDTKLRPEVTQALRALAQAPLRLLRRSKDPRADPSSFSAIFPAQEDPVVVEGFTNPEELKPELTIALRYATVFGHVVIISPPYDLEEESSRTVATYLEGLTTDQQRRQAAPLVYGLSVAIRAEYTQLYLAQLNSPQKPAAPRKRKARAFYLDQALTASGGLIPRLAQESKVLVFYLGRLAMHYSQALATGQQGLIHDLQSCRRRPRSKPCPGRLQATLFQHEPGCDAEPSISWKCPACEDSGLIFNWQGTVFDASHKMAEESAGASTPVIDSFPLTSSELALLQKYAQPGPLAMRLLLMAVDHPSQYWSLEGSKEALHDLRRSALAGFGTFSHGRSAYREICGRLSEWCHVSLDLSLPGHGAEILIHRASEARPPASGLRLLPGGKERCYELQVVVEAITPPISRRILVPASISLDDFHDVIQLAMGWANYHLYAFYSEGKVFGIPSPEDHLPMLDARHQELAGVLQAVGDRVDYNYDFGDDWRHCVELIGIHEKPGHLELLAGERRCPQEDSGGAWGYQDKLEILADRSHERFEEIAGWIGEDFDPEHFDLTMHQERLRQLALAWERRSALQSPQVVDD